MAVRVVLVPDRYLAGQESALVSHVNGGPGVPTLTPPMPFERGIQRRPTLINNVETLAHIALIARHGWEWFREIGTPVEPGSALLTLSGAIEYPGVYEIEYGTPLGDLIEAAGGATSEIKALLLGGYSGTWLPGLLSYTLSLSAEQLAPYGAGLGPGIVLALSEDACGVAETARVTRWLAAQTAGQCGPCVHGLNAIAALSRSSRREPPPQGPISASLAGPRWCSGAAPARIPTAWSASSQARWTCSRGVRRSRPPRAMPGVPSTLRAAVAGAPRVSADV